MLNMKQSKTERFFSEAEQERIRLAVESAEARSAGEIATMIAAESDPYREATLAGSLFVSSAAALASAVLLQLISVWSYLPLLVVFTLPSWLLFRFFPRLRLPFAGKGRISEAVRQRAVRAFYEKGLYRTSHETGVLIFISLLERKVWILGDRGINERIAPEAWSSMARDLARGMAEGRSCDALCDTVARAGRELERHFPRLPDDRNELSDKVLT
jgi:putative membrane protein